VLCSAGAALAFECAPVAGASPSYSVAWYSRCIPYATLVGQGVLSASASRSAIERSFSEWSQPACTDLRFFDRGIVSLGPPMPIFGGIAIKEADSSDFSDFMISPQAAAFTALFYTPATGEIRGATVFLNTLTYQFGDVVADSCRAAPTVYDLQSILVHEFGGALGFARSSSLGSVLLAPVRPCDASDRILGADDVNAVCSVYGAGRATAPCVPPPKGTPERMDLCTDVDGGLDDQTQSPVDGQIASLDGSVPHGSIPTVEGRSCGCTHVLGTGRERTLTPGLLSLVWVAFRPGRAARRKAR
jgi:hypothetical protein